MQSSKEIISNLTSKPYMKKISFHKCFNKLKSLLPPYMQKHILFIYTKNDIMFFVLNHPGMKMEFNYKASLLKSLIKKLSTLDKNCEHLKNIKEVRNFVSDKASASSPLATTTLSYKERAKGEFVNLAKDKEIKKLIEEIRELIKKNH